MYGIRWPISVLLIRAHPSAGSAIAESFLVSCVFGGVQNNNNDIQSPTNMVC